MKLGTDLFTLNGYDYVIVVDYTSNSPEIVKLHGTTSNHVIDTLKSIMARFGIPKLVFSDNAPQFSSVKPPSTFSQKRQVQSSLRGTAEL